MTEIGIEIAAMNELIKWRKKKNKTTKHNTTACQAVLVRLSSERVMNSDES